ncbi:MAG TPA: pilus (MSHA type) biogenesis protein MshL [Burkholderiaceae bacterium]|jgi:MSHA biogenesis protein MshL
MNTKTLLNAVTLALVCATFSCATASSWASAATPERFDLSVDNAPAAQVFMQIGADTPYNIIVSPELSGQVSLRLKSTTVMEVLDALRDLYGYDYRITGNRVFVMPNTVQTRLFRINYLPGRRQGASDLHVTSSAITTAPLSNSGNSGNSGTGNTAGANNVQNGPASAAGARSDDSSHVHTSSDADFWREVQNSLNTLIGTGEKRSVVLNPAAGVLVVRATPAELRQVEEYLKAVQISVERQVMIEAKIVQVQLNDDSQAGINWGAFASSLFGNGTRLALGVAAPGVVLGRSGSYTDADGNTITAGSGISTGASPPGRGFNGIGVQAPNFSALLNFLQTQGNTNVLSSPRITSLNNQKALLKVGSDSLYVTAVTTNTTTAGTSTVSSPTLTLTPFFSGIMLDVTPQIDDEGHVILHVHPAVSVVTTVPTSINLGTLGSYTLPLPTSAVNETDSIVRVAEGHVVAIGGLMQQTTSDDRNGVPGLSQLPVVGGLFRQTATVNRKQELVILIKPTVITDENLSAVEAKFEAK